MQSSAGDESWTLDAAGNVTGVTSGDDNYSITYTDEGGLATIDNSDGKTLTLQRADGAISAIDVDEDLSLGIDMDGEGRLLRRSTRGHDTIVDIEWTDVESFTVGTTWPRRTVRLRRRQWPSLRLHG